MTYTANNGTSLPGTLVCDESNPDCIGGDSDAVNAHVYAGDVYDFYNSYHGRDSIDNAGMTLISTVHYDVDYCNAYWNGSQMVYGDGCSIVVDDVVGHEITHGVTQYESGLFYYGQSGAINESFSDVWGEFIDLTNGKGNDSSDVRWLMGEDTSIGAIRSMSNPPAYNDPDRIGSPHYYCGTSDNLGVHINSGVNNKAAYLMTDGGTFNGKTITGLGITKVAKIYYEAQTNLLLSASDYNDLYNLLQQACTNLIGTNGITPSDCQEVKDAVDATEMNQQPSSCTVTKAPLCPAGQYPNYLFFDNLENPTSGNWIEGYYPGYSCTQAYWYYPQNPNPFFDATYATSGVYNFWGYNYYNTCKYYIRMNLDVSLPSGKTSYMHFNHAYDFEEPNYDGGVVEYSTNGGSSWNDAGSLFIDNGYTGTISSSYDNPLSGRDGFVGLSHGYYSSRLNLGSLAGQNVRFRFMIGTDSSVDDYGWFIDDIKIYTCSVDTTSPTGSITINGGATYTNTTTVILSLSCADSGSGCYQMRFSNDSGNWSLWEPYATSKRWVINSGDGLHNVDVQFKDKAGNISTEWGIWDSIYLDTTEPTNGTLTATPGNSQVSLSWSGFSDGGSGIGSYKLVYSTAGTPDTNCTGGIQIYYGTGTSYIHTGLANGTTYYYRVCAIDNANNTSSGATASATPASTLPDLIIQSITTDPASPLTGQDVYITVTIKNQGSGDVSSTFYVDFYKHRTINPSPYERGDFYCSIIGLAAGATTTCNGTVNYSSPDTYQMWAQVDTNQDVTESDENNNVFGPQDITVHSPYSLPLREDFENGLPQGWAVIDNAGTGAEWRFDDPGVRGNLTGGTGGFAIADSNYYGTVDMDTELQTPVLDMSGLSNVAILFKTDFNWFVGRGSEVADVDVSVDGGATWTNVWRKTGRGHRGPRTEYIDITSLAAGEPDVVIRFHYYNAHYDWWWQVDDVYIGDLRADIQGLITWYYNQILGRDPDQGGLDYWTSEIERALSLGICINEGFIVLGKNFFNSDEYLSRNRTDTEYVTDLYWTFLHRAPDSGGLDYWVGQLQMGLPRNIILYEFIFSQEFTDYMGGIFGYCSVRPEYVMVTDLYRGFLWRLPDDGGFNYWLALIQDAQCNADPDTIRAIVHQIALDFTHSAEYASRGVDNSGFVVDEYDAILRRGGDYGGYQYWLNLLEDGSLTRDDELQFFVNSQEFQGRVQDVIDAGCAY